ncbi:MAG: sodium:proton antiporter [Oscillospiraceae bacterium]|nr:sodium:proton antiporter [Oscillospiraceae bacterium]
MPFVANFPFFCILITMFGGILTAMVNAKWAFRINTVIISATLILNGSLLLFLINDPQYFTFMMGHYPAPWGNEIRFGPLEALMGTVFSFVTLTSLISGKTEIFHDVKERNIHYFYIMINLLLSSLFALIYTNDLFTAYVFVEINTISACAIVMAKESGKTLAATMRYLIMSLLGSGLFLLSIVLTYGVTGQLLMVPASEAIQKIFAAGQYQIPLTVILGLVCVAMAIKSALYPFHTWLSHAHGSATTASSAILSGLVLKGYIILLIKIIVRVFGLYTVVELKALNILFVFAVLAMIIGSIDAIKENHIKRMIAFSSVAQMGYIYMGIGLGNKAGLIAACFHIIVHAITKPMLFSSAGGLASASGHKKDWASLKGSAYRNPIAAVAFLIGSLSMIGIPFFAGFAAKYYLSMAAMDMGIKMWVALAALAVSTVLNAVYYFRALTVIFSRSEGEITARHKNSATYNLAMAVFIVANVLLGLFYQPVMDVLTVGMSLL